MELKVWLSSKDIFGSLNLTFEKKILSLNFNIIKKFINI